LATDYRLGRGQGDPETVFLDANVLYSACCRDLLIEANLAGLCACRWSDGVLVEVRQALRRTRPDLPESALQRTFDLLSVTCPEALSVSRSRRLLIRPALPDPADRHVLAAAYASGASTLLTFNLRHFPSRSLRALPLTAQTPDDWFVRLAMHQSDQVEALVERCRRRLLRPPLSRARHLEAMRASGLPHLAAHLDS
jgi:predicted nucleic acid-binding protein